LLIGRETWPPRDTTIVIPGVGRIEPRKGPEDAVPLDEPAIAIVDQLARESYVLWENR
jgi:hypothetical protein